MSNDKSLREARTGAGGIPVFESATFAHSSAEGMAEVFEGRAPGHVYTRNSNPTTMALESRLTALEGGTGCIATSSGMAALATVMLGLLRPGDEILSATGIFGGSISLFRDVLGPFGVRTILLDAADTDAVQSAVIQATRVIFGA
jgi:O-acetylhomoserine/O-acetylserine sulfhydrylase-like pyridoxal-dependent enzyme